MFITIECTNIIVLSNIILSKYLCIIGVLYCHSLKNCNVYDNLLTFIIITFINM